MYHSFKISYWSSTGCSSTAFHTVFTSQVGSWWKFRAGVAAAGIHRPLVAGIHGREGSKTAKNPIAFSIVLSGGYEDDEDNGEEFIYTGR